MTPSQLNILVACEESQVTTIAFRKRGFRAFSCDLQKPSGGHEEWHIQKDCMTLFEYPCRFRTMDNKLHRIKHWHLLIAHPPCTYLTTAGAQLMFPKGVLSKERYKKMLEGRQLFMALYNAPVECICIENPIPMKICELPKVSTYIQPFWFGEHYSKKTYLWLKNLPPLMPTKIMYDYCPCIVTHRRKNGYKYKTFGTAKTRSKTFPKVAEAFAQQYGDYIKNYY